MRKNTVVIAGMLAVLLAFGLVLIGCDTGTGGNTGGGDNTGGNNADTTTYTVTFYGNGGSSPSSQTVDAGSSVMLPFTTRSGYTLNGWYTASSGGTKVGEAGNSYSPSDSVTLHAQWTQSGNGDGGTTVTIPSVPTNVNATAQSASSISVSWSVVSGATSYEVYYEIGSSSIKNLAETVIGSTSYTHTGLQASTTYYYYIKAKNSAGSSGYSSFTSAKTSSSGSGGTTVTMPSAPTGVNATALSASSISVSWSAVSGATSYEVYYEIGNSTTKNLANTVTGGTSYTHTGLQADTTYWYYIKAVNSAGSSGYSSFTSAKTSSSGSGGTVSAPGAPRNVAATAQSSSSIIISWNAPASGGTPTYYNIWRSASASGSYTEIGSVSGSTTSYTHTGLSASTTYYYKVDAENSAGTSSQSSYVSATTLAAAWTPPSTVGTFSATGQIHDGALNSTSSVVWYKIQFSFFTAIKIMGIDRQSGGYGQTADIVASFYDSTGSVLNNQVNIGGIGSIDRYVLAGQTYYMKVEVNPSASYTGTYRIGIIDQ
jgi:uncharacterized repeat protein (TIGR02543 family)